MTDRLVFAYSGASEAWAAIAQAASVHAADIVTLTLDLGQGAGLEDIRDRALAAGAVRAHVLDAREEFARDYVLPALQTNALQDDPMGLALAAQLVSRKLEEIAAIEKGTPVTDSVVVHDTLLGRRGAAYTLTKAPSGAPKTPAHVEIAFERGVPVAVNGVPMALTELIESLSIIAGHHGVGRIAINGTCAEAPAAVVLVAAYTALASTRRSAAPTGAVRMRLLEGGHLVTHVDPGSPIPDLGSRLTVAPP